MVYQKLVNGGIDMLQRVYVRKRKDEEKIEEEEEQRIEEDFTEAEWRGSSCYEVVMKLLGVV